MDFAFSEEQEMLRGQARSFLADRFPAERVVELAESDDGWDRSSWKEIADLGWIGLSASEASGGAGMSFLDEAVVLEEMGYALFPGPYFSTVALALPALELNPDLAGSVISGEATATFSTRTDLVPDGAAADIIVLADGSGITAYRSDEVDVAPLSTMDPTRRYARVDTKGAKGTGLTSGDSADELLREIHKRALAGAALEAVGVAQRTHDLAREYVKERQQFGKPIGVYQAVAHQVADTFVQLELSRSLAYWAAWTVAESDEQAERAVAAAKAQAADAAVFNSERSIQVHGGIGFTWEHILHRYYKRAQWLQSFEGFASTHLDTIARSLFV